ncbi:LexA family transcriptional regulator [Flavobacterium sp.]|uniref:XRE family transcriptional regulator n=1 Tax=Flavobacterium sp. TaxID=239 RepID=UPI00120DC2CF|nr:LexA family transcriptional regulator [Flavobacterium sp.]RZJ71759.1 MAG: helix-turn-helix domain-containing protein [Flavobacterium sp.]
MSLFSDNIRSLRLKKKLSQEKLAEGLGISRARYSKYEDGRSEAPYDILKGISRFFNVSIDLLLSADIRKIELDELLKLEDNRLLLPIKTDQSGENLIEVVPHKARMGYASGYADPEFIDGLQTISLPFLRSGKFRAFPGSGDSMPPHKDSSLIVGRYVENLAEVKDGKTYVLVTKSEGIVYKRLEKIGKSKFLAQSNNLLYGDYEIKFSEILEVWEFVCSIETEEFERDDLSVETVKGMFQVLRKEIRDVKS